MAIPREVFPAEEVDSRCVDSKSTRDVFKADEKDLFAVLQPLAKKNGPSFCRYGDERAKASDAKLMLGSKDGIETCHELLHGMYKLTNGKMHVPQKTLVKKVLGELLQTEKWKMKKGEQEDWKETVANRIRNVTRVTQQGCNKKDPPKWVKDMPWMKDVGEQAVEEKTADEKAAEEKAGKNTVEEKKAAVEEKAVEEKVEEKAAEKKKQLFSKS